MRALMKHALTSIYTYIKKHPRLDVAFIILGLTIFAIITLINAPRASIWFDEAFSAYIAQFSFWDIARYTASDVHPPFYYWLLKVWVSLFGTTEVAYRSLSILFGAGAATVAFFLSRKLFGRKVAWVSFVFLVFSPMLIRYSDEARMYTLAALIVMGATYVMLKAIETKKRSYWVWYGLLVAVGMWTHYFTALAWLAHWAWRGMQLWRKNDSFKEFMKKFFSKEWLLSYIFAVVLFLPWLPFMAFQLGVVQGAGFWIGPVTASTPINYMTNYFFYLNQDHVQGWLALVFIAMIALIIILLPKAYRSLGVETKSSFMLIASLAFVPPLLLFLTSLPPLRPSFVERYLVPAIVALSIFLAVVLISGTRSWRVGWRIIPVIAVVGMMIVGITNVYKYGNYNKNSGTHIMTREAIEAARSASSKGMPIVTDSPWIFYEAAPYSTAEYPIYFIDKNTQYIFGSLDMLKENDQHKIKDMTAFAKEHPTIWYLGSTTNEDVAPYEASWKKIQTVKTFDSIDNTSLYKATEYRISGE